MSLLWDDDVDAVIAGDAVAGFTYVTPAGGVVIVPMAPMGLRDRAAGTVTLTTSLGLPTKLDRLRRNPNVALSYHAREHGDSTLRHVVLVQGTASVADQPDRAWLESITPQWDHFLGPRHKGPLGRLMDVYYWERLAITIHVRRILVHDGSGTAPTMLGEDLLATEPPPQPPPARGTGPRVDVRKVAAHIERLPHTLLGWVGADGLPMVVRVTANGVDDRGIRLTSLDDPIPSGGRRAGLTSHQFQRHLVGQQQRVHTGWLQVDSTGATYAPHTKAGYALPPSRTVMAAGAVVGMRIGKRKARKLGVAT